MAIDYGTKRTGIATTDPLQIIASGLTTVPTNELIEFMADYLSKEIVDTVIIGEPKRSDGSKSPIQDKIDDFMKKLKEQHPTVNVVTYNEQFSSQRAREMIRMSGAKQKKRRNKALVDKMSASIILKDYMEDNVWL